MRRPGRVSPCSGPTTWTIPWRGSSRPNSAIRCAAAFADSPVDHAPDVAVRNAGAQRRARRHVVIGDAEGEVRAGDAGAPRLELVEGVEGALVDEVAIDPEQGRAVLAGDDRMGVPELVEQRARRSLRLFHPALSSLGRYCARLHLTSNSPDFSTARAEGEASRCRYQNAAQAAAPSSGPAPVPPPSWPPPPI